VEIGVHGAGAWSAVRGGGEATPESGERTNPAPGFFSLSSLFPFIRPYAGARG
jgi:hypothetical protein